MNDIKDVLGAAFADEPPNGIHSETLLRRGRNQLLLRRGAVFGGLAVAAVAAVVGVSAMTGAVALPNTDPGTQPGAPVSYPVVSSSCPTIATTSSSPKHASSPKRCDSTTPEHAAELTAVLAAADVVPAGLTAVDPFEFTVLNSDYNASTDLRTADGATGKLFISVMASSANPPFPPLRRPHQLRVPRAQRAAGPGHHRPDG
ncbi:hypothetical protein [Umezawaea sp. Da 62-37]|uniref:hypothetical protein n=1 Tax=Umezawaea sp. Da 62-37 TaxID=3075927 RepID=UPI0028F74D13|nr:hypothetical protein [Umezawaea sp. Da 62-37]WNV91180.1 hypothetical protein RM788_23750 [Umezawaea sp. Da 62-37]